MSELGLYSISLQTDVERAWCLVYAKKQRDAVVVALDNLDKDFFQVRVGYTMIPWLQVPHLPVTHIGDSLTTNVTYTHTQEVYSDSILSIKPHLRGRRASVQTDQTATVWLGTCLHHAQPHLSGGANYYLAGTQQLSRNDFFGQILAKHDLEIQPNDPIAAQSSPIMAPFASTTLRPSAQYSSQGVTVKVEMISLALDIGSKCLVKENV